MEDTVSDVPELINEQNSDDSDSDEEKWAEINEEQEITACLFCASQFSSIENAIEHLKSAHQFDLAAQKSKFSMDFYSYIQVRIKFINYRNKYANSHSF
jgi:hypothetical protein